MNRVSKVKEQLGSKHSIATPYSLHIVELSILENSQSNTHRLYVFLLRPRRHTSIIKMGKLRVNNIICKWFFYYTDIFDPGFIQLTLSEFKVEERTSHVLMCTLSYFKELKREMHKTIYLLKVHYIRNLLYDGVH